MLPAFEHPTLLALSALPVALAIACRRRAPRGAALAIAGVALLALAAAGPHARRSLPPRVVVMVDASASTRTADFRDAARVRARAATLLGGRHADFFAFGEALVPLGDHVVEQAATRFDPPACDAILLFSDGRFVPPAFSPPVFAALDPRLQAADDAAVTDLRRDGRLLQIDARGAAAPRDLERPSGVERLPPGLSRRVVESSGDESASARIAPGDAWPENDALSLPAATGAAARARWAGDAPPEGWQAIDPAELLSAHALLGASILGIDEEDLRRLPDDLAGAVERFARDYGGTLLVLGSPGGFAPRAPDAALPLVAEPASTPQRWLLLLDRSGSMARPADGRRKFDRAIDAAARLIERLPVDASIELASFAATLEQHGPAVAGDPAGAAPLRALAPGGPTNLRAALASLTDAPGARGRHVVLLSDAQFPSGALDDAADAAIRAGVVVHLLATRALSADDAAARFARSTGGDAGGLIDPRGWTDAAGALARRGGGSSWVAAPQTLTWAAPLDLPPRDLPGHNAVRARDRARALAFAADGRVVAANWSVGAGRVIAAALRPTPVELAALERVFAAEPRDPRFALRWETSRLVRLWLEVDDATPPTSAVLRLIDGTGTRDIPARRDADGRFAWAVDAPASASAAVVIVDGAVVDRAALPARYPAEFDEIGVDLEALRRLAEGSGGAVVGAEQRAPIALPSRTARRSLTPWACAAGAALILAGLLRLARAA